MTEERYEELALHYGIPPEVAGQLLNLMRAVVKVKAHAQALEALAKEVRLQELGSTLDTIRLAAATARLQLDLFKSLLPKEEP